MPALQSGAVARSVAEQTVLHKCRCQSEQHADLQAEPEAAEETGENRQDELDELKKQISQMQAQLEALSKK